MISVAGSCGNSSYQNQHSELQVIDACSFAFLRHIIWNLASDMMMHWLCVYRPCLLVEIGGFEVEGSRQGGCGTKSFINEIHIL